MIQAGILPIFRKLCRENGESWRVVKATSSNDEIYHRVQRELPEIGDKVLTMMNYARALFLIYNGVQLSTKNYTCVVNV